MHSPKNVVNMLENVVPRSTRRSAVVPMPSLATKKRRQAVHAVGSLGRTTSHKANTANAMLSSHSSSIPLPKSHIHRTPSELQLADDLRTAEYQDVRMYARLIVGMQSQCLASGHIHPLSRKSLEGVIQTKQANIDDQNFENQGGTRCSDCDHGWDVSFIDEENSMGNDVVFGQSMTENSSQVSHPLKPRSNRHEANDASSSLHSSLVRTPSDGSMSTISNNAQDCEEDDFVFSLEL